MDYKAEIKEIYNEYCEERNIKFTEKDFRGFLKFLEIDFYDWIKENLRCYFGEKSQLTGLQKSTGRNISREGKIGE